MSDLAIVSLIVPCRNERAFIEAFCADALAQVLPPRHTLQLVVADGASDDGSRAVLDALAARESRLLVVDNPDKIVSCALNRALAVASGEVIVRMDVHTRYADDYVAQCLLALQRSGADNVGGPWRAEGGEGWQRAIATAFQSRWGAGGARSRDLDYEGEVDTVYLGCWPRATFERFGGFDEALVRNQDDEHNLRIALAGGRIWQSRAIRCAYTPRDSLAALSRQWLQYGYWKPFVMKKHGQPAALRHLLPGSFVAALAAALVWALVGISIGWPASWLPLASLVGLYVLALTALSLAIDRAAGLRLWWRLPVVLAVQHLCYGLGSLLGAHDAWRHGHGRARFAGLTR
ncbi:MAG TPA: glycosyltransferase family 2 protein [Burkholderiaceae bacterium]|nr:glycosyltransferase family 2 protein [Burkholderiaceae bacterium]